MAYILPAGPPDVLKWVWCICYHGKDAHVGFIATHHGVPPSLIDSHNLKLNSVWKMQDCSSTTPSLDHENSSRWGAYLQAKHPLTLPPWRKLSWIIQSNLSTSVHWGKKSFLFVFEAMRTGATITVYNWNSIETNSIILEKSGETTHQPQLVCRTSTPGRDSAGLRKPKDF